MQTKEIVIVGVCVMRKRGFPAFSVHVGLASSDDLFNNWEDLFLPCVSVSHFVLARNSQA